MRCPRIWNRSPDPLQLAFADGAQGEIDPGGQAELCARDANAAARLVVELSQGIRLTPCRGIDARELIDPETAPAWPGPDELKVKNASGGILLLRLHPTGAEHRLRPGEMLTVAPWFPEAEFVPVLQRSEGPTGVTWSVHLEGLAEFGGFAQDGAWLDDVALERSAA